MQKAIKGSVLSDYLAHQPVEDYQPMKFDFPDEDILFIRKCNITGSKEGPEPGSRWTLVFDSASNAHGHGCRCNDHFSNRIPSSIYRKTRDHKLIPYREHVMKFIPYFDGITFHHIPRDENQLANALATLSSMFKIQWTNQAPSINVELLDEPVYYLEAEEESYGKPWFYDSKRYVEKQVYPENTSITDLKALRKLASSFFVSGGVLYKRSYDSILLRCVDRCT
ncbi:uncharacterized protein LOC127099592 [Lathyrus oleraceus]|uniref:uncharacterized protein LOC127099592 n=1 Tax=Pisum sativum TaxID=3888 RepID=UPI0021CE3482|nr:uncharacterized protein LOC127099592 [Pisum sativum]